MKKLLKKKLKRLSAKNPHPNKLLFILFLISLLLLISPKTAKASEPTVMIIHQIRGGEVCCQAGSTKLQEELINNEKFADLALAFALRYDALIDPAYLQTNNKKIEIGLLLEITPNLAKLAQVEYKGKLDGSDWHQAKHAFLIGYGQGERKKLIDTLVAKYLEIYKKNPPFTTSWMIDAWSINYLYKTYGVQVHELTKEQYETDNYTLYGGIFNAPYYPSKKHPFIPGKRGNQQDILMVRQTISDLIRNYGSAKAYFTSQPNDYLENPEKNDISYFQSLVDDVISGRSKMGVLGFENSYSFDKYGKEYLKQLEILSSLLKEGRVITQTPSEFAKMYKTSHPQNQPFILEKNFSAESSLGVLWYFGENYRARILLKDKKVILDDLRFYSEETLDPYFEQAAMFDHAYWIVPYLIDGSQQYQLDDQQKKNIKPKKISSDTIVPDYFSSPFGIVLGERFLEVKRRDEQAILLFSGNPKGEVKIFSDGILIDENINPYFSWTDNLYFSEIFHNKKDYSFSFNKHFDFQILPEDNQFQLGWKRDNIFLPVVILSKQGNKFLLQIVKNMKQVKAFNPQFQPDRSDLPLDLKQTRVYWHNKSAISGRNPIRIFLTPLNSLGRITNIRDFNVDFTDGENIKAVYPQDYRWRLTPWFVDVVSDASLETTVSISTDNNKLIDGVKLRFVTDCQKQLISCLKKPSELFWYLSGLVNEQIK